MSFLFSLPMTAHDTMKKEHCMQLNSTQVLHHSLQTTLKGDRTYMCCDIMFDDMMSSNIQLWLGKAPCDRTFSHRQL